MSFVTTQPDLLTTAAAQWAGLDAAMREENSAVAVSTLGAPPPAADEVSVMTAASFAAQAQQYQAISARAGALQQLFIDTLRGNADSYASAEATNVAASAVDPSAVTTIIGAAQSVGSFAFGPGQAAPVVSVISGLAMRAQQLDGVLKSAEAAAAPSPAPASVVAGSSALASTSAAGTGARPAGLRPASNWGAAVPESRPAPAAATSGAAAPAQPLIGHAALAGMAGVPRATRSSKAPDRLQQALAKVSDEPESARHWHTDKANLEDLLDQLATEPGVHAVHLNDGEA
ncbi:PE family protein [[Mycobacterium] vasticus]|uniref:PE family protein n=1 Tax=[Mycobacterium] vasticus TaxID=2875777 RepID=A0ABU5Z3M5_9MYCO|nr:PE family protein [Mycolicibacter sp. MYC017]MEB3071750.1 PE family protein [Mycolicibacter sp. MYC017]